MRFISNIIKGFFIGVSLILIIVMWNTFVLWSYPNKYRPPTAANVKAVGIPIAINEDLMTSLGIPPAQFVTLTRDNVDEFVFVTAITSDHHLESKDAIASIQTYHPGYTIILYDLGLKDNEVKQMKRVCGVVYKKFDFARYPPHVRNLRNYAFKPIIIQEVLLTQSGVFWFDASVRLLSNLTGAYHQILNTSGFLQFWRSPHTNHAITHPTLYRYIPTDIERQTHTQTSGAAAIFWYRTRNIYFGIFYWWLMCALDPDCIAPHGSTLRCNFKTSGMRRFAGCHRFDMSVLNLLASNMFGYEVERYTARQRDILVLIRRVTFMYTLQFCLLSARLNKIHQ